MAAAWILGVSHVEFLGHEDGELNTAASLRAELTRIYRSCALRDSSRSIRGKVRPSGPQEIGMAAIDADCSRACPISIRSTCPDGLAPGPSANPAFNTDEPDYFVDVSRTIEAKLEALRAHTSQWGIWPQTSGGAGGAPGWERWPAPPPPG